MYQNKIPAVNVKPQDFPIHGEKTVAWAAQILFV